MIQVQADVYSALRAADPSRDWEVINADEISYASYRVTHLMNELKRYQPDLFIVYSGQNESLERRSYGRLMDLPLGTLRVSAVLSRTRTWAVMEKAIEIVRPDPFEDAKERYELSGEVDEILKHTLGPLAVYLYSFLNACRKGGEPQAETDSCRRRSIPSLFVRCIYGEGWAPLAVDRRFDYCPGMREAIERFPAACNIHPPARSRKCLHGSTPLIIIR